MVCRRLCGQVLAVVCAVAGYTWQVAVGAGYGGINLNSNVTYGMACNHAPYEQYFLLVGSSMNGPLLTYPYVVSLLSYDDIF